MKKISALIVVVLLTCLLAPLANAIDINLLNVNLGAPESQKAAQLYGNAFGFPAAQVMPTLLGPAEEVPSILKIAQAAGTVPLTVWMMRKMGMSFPRILQNFALAPTVLFASQPASLLGRDYTPGQGSYFPTWSNILNPFLVETARIYFLRNILKVDPLFMTQVPSRGIDFTRAILLPYPTAPGYGLPPGIAKKQGLWIPPGIAKKNGLWMPPGQAKKLRGGPYSLGGGQWEDSDHAHGKKKAKGQKWDAD